jgi:sporulation protein YlmC with PRC-barrel domain
MAHHEVRLSELKSSPVTTSSGESLGSINDVLINPASGKIDFAVISLSSSGTSSISSAGSVSANSSSEKQVAVPWTLLKPSSRGSSSASGTFASSGQSGQHAFTFNGDQSKLQSAPEFEESTDLSQSSWRQSVYSHFGVSPSSATGASESSGGSSFGSSSGSAGTSQQQQQ